MHVPNSDALIAHLCSWDTNEMEAFRECSNEQICPRSNKFSLNFVSRCPIYGARVLRILAAGELKTEKQMNCCFDHFSWRFSETLFFRFGKHVHLVAWVVTVKFSCTTNNTVFSRFAQSLVSCFHGRQCCFQFFWTEHLKGKHYKCFACNSLGLSCLSPPCVQKIRSRPKTWR